MSLDYPKLLGAVNTGAAFRCRVELQPAGGKGDKVFPPTYAGAVYATEKRRIPDYKKPVDCVLLDSVQSQANRMEEALQQAVDDGRLKIPIIEVDFTDYFPGEDNAEEMRLIDPVGKVTSLQVPHRIADAILRDSVVKEDGKPFRSSKEKDESTYGQRLRRVSNQNATVLYELCPTALIFGMWDSTGPKGGLGAKFERAMVSEIVGINATCGVRTASRVDPIITKNPKLYETEDGDWTPLEKEAVKTGTKNEPKAYPKKLSKLNLGNVTPDVSRYDAKSITSENRETVDPMRNDGASISAGRVAPGGVTVERAEQTLVISLAALRRLRFPVQGKHDNKADLAGRTVLAALSICTATLADESGLDLRSRCLLYPEVPLKWKLLDRANGGEFILDSKNAIELLNVAVSEAAKVGLTWREEPLVLRPSDRLVKLVVESQRLALQKGGEQ